MKRVTSALSHPALRGKDANDPRLMAVRAEIIESKAFLKRVYARWYDLIADSVPRDMGPTLELGSGAGFLAQRVGGMVTSDVLCWSGIQVGLDGQNLPFADGALGCIVMVNVLHHIPQPDHLLGEADRCVVPGGRVVMIEPWVSGFSRVVYSGLHPEPFDPEAPEWERPCDGPLSGANQALPWILFARDAGRFRQRFPDLLVGEIRPIMPFAYLLSGGVSTRQLMPGWTFPIWAAIERLLTPIMHHLAMFALIVLERRKSPACRNPID